MPQRVPFSVPLGLSQRLPLGLSLGLRLRGVPLSSPFVPSAAEASLLRFAAGGRIGAWSARRRLLTAGALFVAGSLGWALLPAAVAPVALVLVLIGHVLVWVRTQSTAPGGATPRHEEIWAPVEDEWFDRVRQLEERSARWDATPFDITCGRGFWLLFALLVAIGAAGVVLLPTLGFDAAFRVTIGAVALLVPFWINGIRTTWNPSELEKKGEALEIARAAWTADGGTDFDPVPMLALREGKRGKYPVDAKLMLRPAVDDDSGFLGVQIQVAMNSVQGTDYAYLYAVVLGKDDVTGGFRLPAPARDAEPTGRGVRRLVYESGQGDGARFLVIRQHADTKGGWHTDAKAIRRIVARALELGRETWEANRP